MNPTENTLSTQNLSEQHAIRHFPRSDEQQIVNHLPGSKLSHSDHDCDTSKTLT